MLVGGEVLFDPIVFENLKVAIENDVYDLDNISGEIEVTNRTDCLDLAVMAREFSLQFSLVNQQEITAEIVLCASIKDLADEILEVPGENPGCSLSMRFLLQVEDIEKECKHIEAIINNIWDPDLPPVQTIRFVYGKEQVKYMNTIELAFPHKINEEHIRDIPKFVDHIVNTLNELNQM
jgi:hypothetical protein